MKRIGLLLLTTMLLASCGPSPEQQEATVQAGMSMTQTAMPTNTATPKPTNTPRPTPTIAPTPADLGDVVKSGQLEITLVAAYERPTMHIGDVSGRYYIYYTAPEGAMILDVMAKVVNTKPGTPYKVSWGDVFVKEQNGDSWYPIWAKVQAMPAGSDFDAKRLGISSDDIDPSATVEFAEDTYLRMVYLVSDKKDQTLKFHIEDSPPIAFTAAKAP